MIGARPIQPRPAAFIAPQSRPDPHACYGNSAKSVSRLRRSELTPTLAVGIAGLDPLASRESIADIKIPLGQSREALFVRGTLNDPGSEQS